jgi:hypothetical protein
VLRGPLAPCMRQWPFKGSRPSHSLLVWSCMSPGRGHRSRVHPKLQEDGMKLRETFKALQERKQCRHKCLGCLRVWSKPTQCDYDHTMYSTLLWCQECVSSRGGRMFSVTGDHMELVEPR